MRDVPRTDVEGEKASVEDASTDSGEDGRFTLNLPIAVGRWVVTGETSTAIGVSWAGLYGGERVAHLDLTLVEARESLSGVAVDGEGRPWNGVLRIAASGASVAFGALPTASTDPDGGFRFDHLAVGEYLVGAELGPTTHVFGPTVHVPATTPYRFVAAAVGRTVDFRTLDAATGVPIEGTRISISASRECVPPSPYASDLVGRTTVIADQRGRASCVAPETDAVSVFAFRTGYVGDTVALPTRARTCTLKLTKGGTLRGTVVTADGGTPGAGLDVVLSDSPERRTTTDADGAFLFEGVGPTVRNGVNYVQSLTASGRGFVPIPRKPNDPPAPLDVRSGETTTIILHVGRGRTIVGLVRRADGSPASDAEVWVATNGWFQRAFARDGSLVRADENGAFRIEGVPLEPSATDVRIFARAPGTGTARLALEERSSDQLGVLATMFDRHGNAKFEHRPGRKTDDPIVLVLPAAGSTDITAVDQETGKPIADLPISLSLEGSIEFSGATDPEGRIHATGLTPSALVVSTADPSWGIDERTRRVDNEHEPAHLNVVDVPASGTGSATVAFERRCKIGGRIVYADGSPVRNESFGLHVKGASRGYESGSDVAGDFSSNDMPFDDYDVSVVNGNMESVFAVVADSTRVLGRARIAANINDAVIRLSSRPPIPIEVHVVDVDGHPLESGSIKLVVRTQDDDIAARLFDRRDLRFQDGLATIEGLRIPIWLEVLADADVDADRRGSWAPARVGPIAPGIRSIDVRVVRGGSISGRVVDPAGKGVGGVPLVLFYATEFEALAWHDRKLADATTADDGTFRFDGVPPGPQELWAYDKPPLAAPNHGERVEAGRSDVRFQLYPLVDVNVTVLDADGRPAQKASVIAYQAPWYGDVRKFDATTDADGVAHFKGLDTELKYVLETRRPTDDAKIEPRRIENWSPAPTTVRLEAPARIRVRVVNDKGDPVSGSYVRFRHADHVEDPSPDWWVTEADGHVDAIASRPGPQWVVATYGLLSTRTERVEAGVTDVTLTTPKPAGDARIEVIDWPHTETRYPGQPPAEWFLWDENDLLVRNSGRPTAEGVIELKGLSAGRVYGCVVIHHDRPEFVARVTGIRAGAATRRVERQPIVPLAGRVVAPEGGWASDVTVVEIGDANRLDEKGRFKINGLPAGAWTLRASGTRARSTVYSQVRTDGSRVPDLVLPSR